MMDGSNGRVKVFARIRPTARFAQDMIELLPDGKSINIHCNKDLRRGYINNQILDWSFHLDSVLHNASQDDVYEECAKDIVSKTLDGYNGTILAYGQTGAGKTFTMTGSTQKFQHRGITPRAIQQLFREISERPENAVTVRVSYLEIYNETMFDLLATLPGVRATDPNLMTVTEDENGFTRVKGLSVHQANSEEEALNLLFEGETNRIVAEHSLNKQSSRSHCIFTVYIESHSRVDSNTKYSISKINFVDLAGSERLGKTLSQGETQVEAMYINKSLTFLEQAVIALADHRREHIPFRQSKLTHVLKDCLGGKCSTLLIANVWGEAAQLEETLSTLRFASRMMNVPCEPAIIEHFDALKLCKSYEKEIRILRQELAMHDTLTNRSQISYEPLSESQIQEVREQVKRFLAGELGDIELVNVRQIKETFAQFRTVVSSMETELEEKLRQKFVLQEKPGTAPGTSGKPSTVAGEQASLVGEVDGQGFGLGVAPSGVKPNVATLVGTRRVKSRGKGKDSARRKSPGQSDGPGNERTQTSSQSPGLRASTPPPKGDAFEEFKQERGSEINRILNENKEIVREKKKAVNELSSAVNVLKKEIDDSRDMLEDKRKERLEEGSLQTEQGQVVIEEDEYEYLRKVQELKARYRKEFEELQNAKHEVSYCEKLVNQCRHRLLTEFDSWYSESFLGPDEQLNSLSVGAAVRKVAREGQVPDDEQEKFDRLQLELLMEHPDSVPYYNAKMQTERRIHLTTSGQRRRKAGSLVASVRNKPPTTLTVT